MAMAAAVQARSLVGAPSALAATATPASRCSAAASQLRFALPSTLWAADRYMLAAPLALGPSAEGRLGARAMLQPAALAEGAPEDNRVLERNLVVSAVEPGVEIAVPAALDAPLDPVAALKLESDLLKKKAKRAELRRKRLVRKRHLRKKGKWPPSKMKKLKNV